MDAKCQCVVFAGAFGCDLWNAHRSNQIGRSLISLMCLRTVSSPVSYAKPCIRPTLTLQRLTYKFILLSYFFFNCSSSSCGSVRHLPWNLLLHLYHLIPPLAKLAFAPQWPPEIFQPRFCFHHNWNCNTHTLKPNCPFCFSFFLLRVMSRA